MKEIGQSYNTSLKYMVILLCIMCFVLTLIVSGNIKSDHIRSYSYSSTIHAIISFPALRESEPLPIEEDSNEILSDDSEMPDYFNGMIEDFDSFRNSSSLPRTSATPYNALDTSKRYLMYSPSGGFNNQYIEFIFASYIAKISDRILIVPPAGSHTSMFGVYEQLTYPDLMPMDHCINFHSLESETGIELLPLNISLKDFCVRHLQTEDISKSSPIVEVVRVTPDADKRVGYFLKKAKTYTEKPVLFFRGSFFFLARGLARKSNDVTDDIAQKARPSPFLFKTARLLRDAVIGKDTAYNAMHVRLGDFLKDYQIKRVSLASFLSTALSGAWNLTMPVYIASELGYVDLFTPIRMAMPNAIRFTDLMENEEARRVFHAFTTRLPTSSIIFDTFGIVEQLLCAGAENFIGTKVSTFSKDIVHFQSFEPISAVTGESKTNRLAMIRTSPSDFQLIKTRLGVEMAKAFKAKADFDPKQSFDMSILSTDSDGQ